VELIELDRHYPLGDETYTVGYGVEPGLSDRELARDYTRFHASGVDTTLGRMTRRQRADLLRAAEQALAHPSLVDAATVSGSGSALDAAKSDGIVDGFALRRFSP